MRGCVHTGAAENPEMVTENQTNGITLGAQGLWCEPSKSGKRPRRRRKAPGGGD